MKIDLLIKGGFVIDPSRNIAEKMDVAVLDGKIMAGNRYSEENAIEVIHADGMIVCPGLIDMHCHFDYLNTFDGVPADTALIPTGVTAAADAGSTGVSNVKGLLHYMDSLIVKTRVYLNVSAAGIMMPSQFQEDVNPETWNEKLIDDAIRFGNGRIIGLKIRTSKKVVKEMGLKPLQAAANLATSVGLPLVVHPTDPPVTMGQICDILNPGDILCHVYQGMGHVLTEGGLLSEGVREAHDRGVLFDVAHGRLNFSFAVAEKAIYLGFLPDTISTDMSMTNWNKGVMKSLPNVMSKFLALGLSLPEVIACTTFRPAKCLGMEGDWGTLAPGTCADITILEQQTKPITFQDPYGRFCKGNDLLVPKATIIDGRIVYRSGDLL